MNLRVLSVLGGALALLVIACGPSAPPSSSPAPPAASAPPAETPPPPAETPPPAPAASSAAPAAPPAPAPVATVPEVTTDRVTGVANEISTPAVVTPDKVIATLRPRFNACFTDGLKKDPKTAGSVTLSAKIEKDGKVSAVTPKMLTGFSPAVVKCLSDHLKTANFAAAGGMNYATSLDIPLSFTNSQP